MDAEIFVLNTLGAMPKRTVKGKKRLQKLCFFAIELGANVDVSFRIHDFGPYSPEVSNAAELLLLFGYVSESNEPVGLYQKFVTVYSLADSPDDMERFDSEVSDGLSRLDAFTSIELEVASTIRYFISREGKPLDRAIACTKEIKPTKTTDAVLKRAITALEAVKLSA